MKKHLSATMQIEGHCALSVVRNGIGRGQKRINQDDWANYVTDFNDFLTDCNNRSFSTHRNAILK